MNRLAHLTIGRVRFAPGPNHIAPWDVKIAATLCKGVIRIEQPFTCSRPRESLGCNSNHSNQGKRTLRVSWTRTAAQRTIAPTTPVQIPPQTDGVSVTTAPLPVGTRGPGCPRSPASIGIVQPGRRPPGRWSTQPLAEPRAFDQP